ncbi:MAG: hypothetical protein IJ379_13095 [Lachnospiraceae bacterium]|nr:hypothetical protein [Lachnospiraceae bacterium]
MRKETTNNTIFDDVFRTMVQKMPQLLIPVINEVFQTNYAEDDYISQLRNEHEEQYGKGITDSIIQIGKKLYHIECQSTEDSTMVIRMIEYDFAIALEQTLLNGKPYEMDFPNSCVLYLRHTNNTPNELELKVNLPQGGSFLYKTPIIKVQHYTRDVIFQKKLLFFLPYYIIRYEKTLPDICEDSQKLNMLLKEYEDIRNRLEIELYDEGKSVLYEDLMKLIILISDYMIKSQEVRERFGDVMGGKVLELESERLLRIGREEGRQEGREEGREEGAMITIIAMYRGGKVTLEEASSFLGISVEDFVVKEKEYRDKEV